MSCVTRSRRDQSGEPKRGLLASVISKVMAEYLLDEVPTERTHFPFQKQDFSLSEAVSG